MQHGVLPAPILSSRTISALAVREVPKRHRCARILMLFKAQGNRSNAEKSAVRP
jgi:hypothetical protein